MKPFDLEAAMRGEPIVTRDGREAKFVAYVPEADVGHRLIVFIEGAQCVTSLYKTGTYLDPSVSDLDLFMAPPPMLSINGHDFPEPVREPLKEGQEYWRVDLTLHDAVVGYKWGGDECEFRWLDRGLIQLTEEGAQQQLKAMLAVLGVSND